MKNLFSLSLNECSAIRGIAIIMIFVHNYCHWIFSAKENEYQFSRERVNVLNDALSNFNWDFPAQIFSFFGHYGIPIFLFLSAYGLVKKYEITPPHENIKFELFKNSISFLKTHYLKLVALMLLGYTAFFGAHGLINGETELKIPRTIANFLMVANLNPKTIHIGPFWYFALMMQLYIIYRIILFPVRSKKYCKIGLPIAISIFCCLLHFVAGEETFAMRFIRFNAFGGILPFSLGLIFARLDRPQNKIPAKKSKWIMPIIFTGATALVYPMSLEFISWIILPAIVCVWSIAFIKCVPEKTISLLAWIGGISSFIFVFHPTTRAFCMIISNHGLTYTGIFIYIASTILVAATWRFIAKNL